MRFSALFALIAFHLVIISVIANNNDDYEKLNIVLVNAYERLPLHVEKGIAQALDMLQSAISVVVDGQGPITISNVTYCLPAYAHFSRLTLMRTITNTRSFMKERIVITRSTVFNTNGINLIIIIEKDPASCAKDPSILATAKPCPIRGTNRYLSCFLNKIFINYFHFRPIMATMNICLNNNWKEFENSVDLFRHEVLHGLGLGTLNAVEEAKKALLGNETYEWTLPVGSKKARRIFMDYSNTAIIAARRHFGCNAIRGIEAEDANKIHLNEYIFGNELMTPFLSRHNYFSDITASILESTYIGNRQWYQVDRRIIESEIMSYWYGRNWGCEFALRSCFEYIFAREQEQKATFPFCAQAEIRFGKARVCFFNQRAPKRPLEYVTACEPIYGFTPLQSLAERDATEQLTRQCPFVSAVIDDSLPYSIMPIRC